MSFYCVLNIIRDTFTLMPRISAKTWFLFLLVLFLVSVPVVQANDFGVSIDINFGDVGDVIVAKDGKFILSNSSYDPNIYGVIADTPIIGIQNTLLTSSKMVSTYGQAVVKVSSVNGEIKKGDYLTSSDVPGVAQKADKHGQVLGIALENYNSADKTSSGKINAYISVETRLLNTNLKANLLEALRDGTYAAFITPLATLRYLLAALMVASTFVIGFWTFARFSNTTIQAIGRNPLAKRDISKSLFFNLAFILAIMVIGLGLAYLILVL